MKCPKCGSESEVLATRTSPRTNAVTRRRRCLATGCGAKFTTHETVRWVEGGVASRSLGSTQLPVAGSTRSCEAPCQLHQSSAVSH
jgi:transcriptional regulator NrdR family protein